MTRLEIDQLHWWYWFISWVLIVAGLAGVGGALEVVAVLAGVQVLHYRWLRGSFSAFAVQVRLVALGMFLAGLAWPGLFVIAAVGLFARCTVNYCLIARLLKLMPWNRTNSLTLADAARVLLQRPTNGPLTVPQP